MRFSYQPCFGVTESGTVALNGGARLTVGDDNSSSLFAGSLTGKFGATGDFAFVVRELTALDDPHLDAALRGLAGEIHASALRVTEIESQTLTDLVRNEL